MQFGVQCWLRGIGRRRLCESAREGQLCMCVYVVRGSGSPDTEASNQPTEELGLPRCHIDHLLGREPKDFHDAGQLVMFVVTREERFPGVQFTEHRTHTPHVDLWTVIESQDHFRSPVEATLDVAEGDPVLEATRTEIDQAHALRVGILQKHVLRPGSPITEG